MSIFGGGGCWVYLFRSRIQISWAILVVASSRSCRVHFFTKSGRPATIFCQVWLVSDVQRFALDVWCTKVCLWWLMYKGCPWCFCMCAHFCPLWLNKGFQPHNRKAVTDLSLAHISKFRRQLIQRVVVPVVQWVCFMYIWDWSMHSGDWVWTAERTHCPNSLGDIVIPAVFISFLGWHRYPLPGSLPVFTFDVVWWHSSRYLSSQKKFWVWSWAAGTWACTVVPTHLALSITLLACGGSSSSIVLLVVVDVVVVVVVVVVQ